jgi:hypothetical protein
VLGKHASRLNELEKRSLEKEEAARRKTDLETAVSWGQQAQIQIDPTVYAVKVLARTKANSVAYVHLVQKLLGLKYLFSPENEAILTTLATRILGNASTSIQDSEALPQKETLEKEMVQFKAKVMEEVGKWQVQYQNISSKPP